MAGLSIKQQGRAVFLVQSVVILMAASASFAQSNYSWKEGFHLPGVSSSVSAIAIHNGDLYIGTADSRYEDVLRLQGTEWQGVPGLEGKIEDFVEFEGRLLAAGGELVLNGIPVGRVVASWDGSQWQPLGGVFGGKISTLHVHDGRLFAGGHFAGYEGQHVHNVAEWDGATWNGLDGGLAPAYPNHDAYVTRLVTYEGDLMAVGWFDIAAGTGERLNNVARWSGTAWEPLGSGVDDCVLDATVWRNWFAIAGPFEEAGGVTVSGVALWWGDFWGSMGDPPLVGYPSGLTVHQDDLVAVGLFYPYGSHDERDWIRRHDGSQWHRFGTGLILGSGGKPTEVVSDGEDLYVGGKFLALDGVTSNNIVRWRDEQAETLGDGLGLGDGSSWNFLEFEGALLVGGRFSWAGCDPIRRLAQWNGEQWQPFRASLDGSHNGVLALAQYAGDVVFAGYWIGSNPVIFRWNGSYWSGFGQAYGHPYAMIEYDSDLIVVGTSPLISGVSSGGLARYDGSTWHDFGTEGSGVPVFDVAYALTIFEGDLIVGGHEKLPGQDILRFDGTEWHPLGGGFGGDVRAFTIHQGKLVVGGKSSQVRAWDGSDWSDVGPEFADTPLAPEVWALTTHEGDLYAGGRFSLPEPYIVRLEDGEWVPLGGELNSSVRALVSYDGDLYAAGGFTTAGVHESYGIAVYGATEEPPTHTDVNVKKAARASILVRPNPVRDDVDIFYSLPRAGRLNLSVFDVTGRRVRVLRDGLGKPGVHCVTWDGRGTRGEWASSGVYFVRLEIDGETVRSKIVLRR